MASFIYFYAKFTEELLLLSAAGIFTLLSIYCYTWVVKKRRLGAARDQVPAGMVKVYLNQLINEAQFVRTQLFGLVGGTPPDADHFAAHFQAPAPGAHAPSAGTSTAHAHHAPNAEIPADLAERLKALQAQLAEKESMVVNINVEKTKLLEEVANFRESEKAGSQAAAGNNDELIQKIKALEERLEEYALFEDDLANLKRLQQENSQLKKQLENAPAPQVAAQAAPAVAAPQAPAPVLAAVPTPEPEAPVVAAQAAPEKSFLDQSAIDALLDGQAATPPTAQAIHKIEDDSIAALAEATAASLQPVSEPIQINAAAIAASAAHVDLGVKMKDNSAPEQGTRVETQAPSRETGISKTPEENFERLVDSVEDSLTAAPVASVAAAPASSAPAEKSDEELLKEFENLLNS